MSTTYHILITGDHVPAPGYASNWMRLYVGTVGDDYENALRAALRLLQGAVDERGFDARNATATVLSGPDYAEITHARVYPDGCVKERGVVVRTLS